MQPILKISIFVLLAGVLFYISCKKEYSCENCNDKNKPPTAIAGGDQVITLPKDSVTLDGSASTDPDGTITTYKWLKISGPLSSIIIKTDSSKTLVKSLVTGVYKFELTVTDNGSLSAKDTVQIIVDDPAINQPPIADAGADRTITLPKDSVNINGSGSTDPDNNITSYAWTKISGQSSFNISNANAVQTPVTNLAQGVYLFELKVTDAGGLFSKDTMQVTVNAGNPNNLPPVARAGNDSTIQSNQTSCTPVSVTIALNGSKSYDPDGTIVNYLWTGPGVIAVPNAAITTVSGLMSGINSFILKVTDNNGASADDTVQFTIIPANRPLVQARLIPFGKLSTVRTGMTIASAGNKILFAGGDEGGGQGSTRVDIYDMVNQTWSIAELSTIRWNMPVVTYGNKIFFAGGHTNDQASWDLFATVDIYDASTNTWSTAQLSERRMDLATAIVGNKILFAGGVGGSPMPSFVSNKVDIYDISANTWSTATLSEARACMTAVAAGNKIYFTGGNTMTSGSYGLSCNASNRIDIYDNTTGSWSTSSMSIPLAFTAGIAVGNKIFLAGGESFTCTFPYSHNLSSNVEIIDINTQTSSFDCLLQPISWPGVNHGNRQNNVVVKDNKIVFFYGEGSGSSFDIYDIASNTWSIGSISGGQYATIISINNTIYVADWGEVWKLNF